MDQNTVLLIGVMAFFGVLGGFIGYILSGGDGTEGKTGIIQKFNGYQALIYMVTGIGAALLVPLFLNTISSDLMQSVPGDGVKMLVFAGFCLLAAIFSKTFIDSIGKKALAEIEKARNEAAGAAEKADILAEKATEADEEQLSGDNLKLSAVKADDPDRIKVLKALNNGAYIYRSLSGISKEINLGKEQVNRALMELISRDYAKEENRKKGIRWFITAEGREFLGKQMKP